jgi:hypothetical protein
LGDNAFCTPQVAIGRVLDRSVSYRVIVSNFDAAFRVVAANPGISVIPVEVSGPFAATRSIKVILLSDVWAQRKLFLRAFKEVKVPLALVEYA